VSMRRVSRLSSFASAESRLHFRIDRDHTSTTSNQTSETSSVTSGLDSRGNTTGITASSRRLG
ncbi:unnamed protein product, partial [Rotaria socialis]